ncbi:MAG: class I SAM-dependent methyltransferase [Pseudomonadota bacterium]|nr:class I SAM-dependent methyltransferase [Pseudomonadota bacterium]
MTADLFADGFAAHNIWQHSDQVRDLYARRARDEAEEMTCAAQAAELLAGLARPGDSLLDAGCGSGYFFHSLRRRNISLDYYGIDATAMFIEQGRAALGAFGLAPERLMTMRIEDFRGTADHVLCMNVLSNIDNYHRPLERLLKTARRSLILRESVKDGALYSYVRDNFLDCGLDLKVHVNAYDRRDIVDFIHSYGFSVDEVIDRRSGGKPEDVIGHPHYWTFLVARRKAE